MNQFNNAYQANTKLDQNAWITPPSIPDPVNIPEPLGWTLLVRPYPVAQDTTRSKVLLPTTELDYLNYVTNIGRVIAIGPCCWSRPEHKVNGEQKDWVKVGDFISYPKNVGARRKFKDVSYVLLVDDEIVERLPDPQVFNNSFYKIDIPEEHLKIYNTVYKEPK